MVLQWRHTTSKQMYTFHLVSALKCPWWAGCGTNSHQYFFVNYFFLPVSVPVSRICMRHCRFASIHSKLWLINGAEEQKRRVTRVDFFLFFFILQHKGSWRVRSRVLPKHEWPTLGNVPECVLFPVHCRLQSSRPNTSPALPAITDLKASGNGRDLCHFVAVKKIANTEIASIRSKKAPKSVVIAEPRPFKPVWTSVALPVGFQKRTDLFFIVCFFFFFLLHCELFCPAVCVLGVAGWLLFISVNAKTSAAQ